MLNDSRHVLSAASNQAYFASDPPAIRVTMRRGFGILRPNQLARLTVNETPAKQ